MVHLEEVEVDLAVAFRDFAVSNAVQRSSDLDDASREFGVVLDGGFEAQPAG